MARIAGVNIPNHQHAVIALTAIYGIGRTRSQLICQSAGVNSSSKMKDLTDAEVEKLREEKAKVPVLPRGNPKDVKHEGPIGIASYSKIKEITQQLKELAT